MPIHTGKDIEQAATLILQAWRNPGKPLTKLPDPLRPANLAHAYGIQQAVSKELGAIGGWLIWQSPDRANLLCAPLPLASIHPSPMHLASVRWTYRRLGPKICLRIGASLPDYDAPYSRDRIIAAIESCHAAVEVRQPRFAGAGALDALTALADSVGYGCLVHCRQGVPWGDGVVLRHDLQVVVGNTEISARAMDPGYDVIEALRWLVNEGSRWAGGLMVGHLVAIAAGEDEIQAPRDLLVRVVTGGLGSIEVSFDSDEPRRHSVHRSLWAWTRPRVR